MEGHTDTQPYAGHTAEESENLNLKLSQDRSMEVVEECSCRSFGHGGEARVLPRKAVGERSRGAGAGGHAGRKQAGNSEDPRKGRRSGADEGGGPVNFTLVLCNNSTPRTK